MATLFDMEPLAESGLKLNEAQRRAITHGQGPLLVIAGAGTGKTRVITERIRHLLESDETLSGEDILGLTFTKKAAGEMKARVVKATGGRDKAVTLATFHSFCETLLTEADPQRVMLDQFDHWILLRRNLERLRLEKYRRLADPGQFLNDFVEFFSRCQDELVSSEDYQCYATKLAARLEADREALDAPATTIVPVGDNDQAIYRFRGASFASFKLFLERFAGWKEGEDSTPFRVTLTENYRSTPNILRVAMQVIGQNTVSADFPKKILSPNKPEGEKIRIVELATPEEESRWVAAELQRLHGAGRRWKDFAVLYRQHAHRDHLVEELSRRKIPFVIANLSILEHPVVKDMLAYLRLIAARYDDIACARVLGAPAWHLEAADLVRLAERARKDKKAIYDILQLPQGQLAFDQRHAALGQLVEFVSSGRKALKRSTAREILGSLGEWLEIPQRVKEHDRKYVTRLTEFMKEWEPKSETRGLAEFIEYLDYYAQAGGAVSLEEDAPGDAVQLMTVHGAKGLEFPHGFLLRVNNRAIPATERPRVFEFPVDLMKEGSPAEQFHIQEERRLFYVALTRAEERLTITTVTEKRGKVPVFIEDIVMEPAVKRQDVRQMRPKLPPTRIADRAREGRPEDAQLFLAAAEPAMSFGAVMHTTIRRFIDQLRKGVKLPFDEVRRIFETEWNSKGFEDEYQEGEYKKDGLEQLRVFHAGMMAEAPQALELEKAFELPLENNVVIKGRIDQINSLGNKRDVEIVDYKTGRPKKDADAKKDLQLSLYALAVKEILELQPVRLVFHYLQDNQRQETTRDAKQLDEAQRIVQEAAADIRAGQFRAKRGFVCRNCAYRPICPAHEEALSA